MATQTMDSSTPPRLSRSVGAILAALVVVVVLSLATDHLFHVLNVYPEWGQPMHDPWLNLLALTYRLVYGVLGGYIAARLAPRNPMRHAWIVGFIGLALSALGAIASIPMDLGPTWYPLALVITALPCAWLGGVIAVRTSRSAALTGRP
jgi:hypothetical protein